MTSVTLKQEEVQFQPITPGTVGSTRLNPKYSTMDVRFIWVTSRRQKTHTRRTSKPRRGFMCLTQCQEKPKTFNQKEKAA